MTCKDKDLDEYPGFTCVGGDGYAGCWQHFGKIESFDNHFILLDPTQPQWPLDDWTDEQSAEHEKKWPNGNQRCASPHEIAAMGLRLDGNLVWRTPEEDEVTRRLQESLGREIKIKEDGVGHD